MSMTRGKRWILIGVVAILAMFPLYGCGQKKETAQQEEQIRSVTTEQAQEGYLEETVQLSGTVTGSVEVQVLPKIPGKVEQVAVKPGDRVKQGQLLIRMDESDVRAQVAQAEAGLQAAQAGAEQARVQSEAQVANAQSAVAQAEGGMKQAGLQLEQAKEAYANLQKQVQELQRLVDAGMAKPEQLQQAKQGLRQAEVAVKQAQTSYDTARSVYQAALRGLKAAEQQSAVKGVRAQVAQAEAALDAARQQLENTRVVAPVSGTVASVNVAPGEMAAPNVPVVTIVQMNPAVVEVQLPEGLYDAVTAGQEMQVQVNGQLLTGKVKEKSLTTQPMSKTYLLKIEVANADGRLYSGMTVGVILAKKVSAKGILIPVAAYMDGETPQTGRVMVVKDGVVEERQITIGKMTSQKVQVLSGLQPGEQVVTKGQHLLRSGDKVRVVQPDASRKGNQE